MRVVGGRFRGRALVAPKGDSTRPTSDRVREAVFSTLVSRFDVLDHAHVLDLFAGSGALGLEAISRGATSATFVESRRAARDALGRNIDVLGVRSITSVDPRDAFHLAGTPPAGAPFPLLFLDPPYRIEPARVRELLEDLACANCLDAGAVVVYEHRTGVEAQWPHGFENVAQRVYGETTVSYGLWHAEKEHIW
ncbi:MAG: 16S rRNA (guanine(966)-N(2))-methyltransferase RsmD [Coriobacteriia bacterium]|nr:16S rRNA (guanine(966)-N(2))-methyltransferase RsmD [Coriobacteriia bacterium]